MSRELATLKKKIGLRLRSRRIALKMSQEEVAFKADISPTYLSQVEAGSRNPSLEALFNLANALTIELPELLKP
jgi:transcriptional regulator with XRE-family HTH domain